ncbi:hypothetical protein SAZ_21705 [Streptomyces noursei ZPM]|uniref:Uncharacterized protein n=1 Tax=Streptomyces noursei TaxID=1971 RepID=A0A401R3G0_STRNR|nr:hypothetical protein SAZ_21705 [Streptomyces noursei ZPM]EOS98356.1 hypothetical protein K530_39386 [Streptomyces noursei CCRC 11814]EXU90915.1 hypothetical protein P354_11310 [Streptomyces noursei PD-1]GCB92161.1 hypothetical protein SALB_04920 [Streptomyces noursei]
MADQREINLIPRHQPTMDRFPNKASAKDPMLPLQSHLKSVFGYRGILYDRTQGRQATRSPLQLRRTKNHLALAIRSKQGNGLRRGSNSVSSFCWIFDLHPLLQGALHPHGQLRTATEKTISTRTVLGCVKVERILT